MATFKKKVSLFESEEGVDIKRRLQLMVTDGTYNTKSSYSADSVLHPDNLISFVDKHIKYLDAHPRLDPDLYIANLRLMTRIR